MNNLCCVGRTSLIFLSFSCHFITNSSSSWGGVEPVQSKFQNHELHGDQFCTGLLTLSRRHNRILIRINWLNSWKLLLSLLVDDAMSFGLRRSQWGICVGWWVHKTESLLYKCLLHSACLFLSFTPPSSSPSLHPASHRTRLSWPNNVLWYVKT